jgi:hypothetical protein
MPRRMAKELKKTIKRTNLAKKIKIRRATKQRLSQN